MVAELCWRDTLTRDAAMHRCTLVVSPDKSGTATVGLSLTTVPPAKTR